MGYLGLHLIKILDIFILGNVYLFLGVITSDIINYYIAKPYDKKKSKQKCIKQHPPNPREVWFPLTLHKKMAKKRAKIKLRREAA